MKANLSKRKIESLTVAELKSVLSKANIKFRSSSARKSELVKLVLERGDKGGKWNQQIDQLINKKRERSASTPKNNSGDAKRLNKNETKQQTGKKTVSAASQKTLAAKTSAINLNSKQQNQGENSRKENKPTSEGKFTMSKDTENAQKALISLTSHIEESPLIDKLTRCKGKVKKSICQQFNNSYANILNTDVRFLRSAFKPKTSKPIEKYVPSTVKSERSVNANGSAESESCGSCCLTGKGFVCAVSLTTALGLGGYLLLVNNPSLMAYVQETLVQLSDKLSPLMPELNPAVIGISGLVYVVFLILIFLWRQTKLERINVARVILEEIKQDLQTNKQSSLGALDIAERYAGKYGWKVEEFEQKVLHYVVGLIDLDGDFKDLNNKGGVRVWSYRN